jgi:UDP-N-acetylglucosamine--dolichyl-phosphate N-acetylglucosaminephosphotransferase
VREDGTLEVPNPFTLKWVLPYYFGMTERQTVLAMYALTLPFCVLGLFIPS